MAKAAQSSPQRQQHARAGAISLESPASRTHLILLQPFQRIRTMTKRIQTQKMTPVTPMMMLLLLLLTLQLVVATFTMLIKPGLQSRVVESIVPIGTTPIGKSSILSCQRKGRRMTSQLFLMTKKNMLQRCRRRRRRRINHQRTRTRCGGVLEEPKHLMGIRRRISVVLIDVY